MNGKIFAIYSEIGSIRDNYTKNKSIESFKDELLSFIKEYGSYYGVGDLLLSMGEAFMDMENKDAGTTVFKEIYKSGSIINNKTRLYLRLAEYYIESGNIDEGTRFLMLLCTKTVDNYEESIATNKLTDLWFKYKPLVEGKIPRSVSINDSATPVPPDKCQKQIGEIFESAEEDILSELSVHLNEMSAMGECINYLNKWEKTVYFANELCERVNSGGFEEYLSYNGTHFEKAYTALSDIGVKDLLALMDKVRSKFPKNKIPKSESAIQNTLDKMEEKDINFESEDSVFYEKGEKELIQKLLDFVLENQKHFR